MSKEFQIGLAMSGAVSAGAYTAGVFDFLIQALDEWEAARSGPDADKVPNHRVGLKVMSGASAGAITAAIGAVALADADQRPGSYSKGGQSFDYHLPKLYETWVVKPDLAVFDDLKTKPSAAITDLLDVIDLDGPARPEDDFSRTSDAGPREPVDPMPVASLLNARLLDTIAKAGITVEKVVGVGAAPPPRAYVSSTLHIYLTLSNLRGVPYRIPFDGGDYHMISHGDRVHYRVEGMGTWSTASKFADADKPRTIRAAWLPKDHPNEIERLEWKDYAICALASAAFPVGLAPRDIGATLGKSSPAGCDFEFEYDGRQWPVEGVHNGDAIKPNWPTDVLSEPPFWFRTADGGIIDNDPFEYARFTLKEDPGKHLEAAPEQADRAVIMISPFPEEKPILPEGQPAADLVSVFSALMPSLIDQARFKPSELVLAANEKHASRYLIGPSRVEPKRDSRGNIERDAAGKIIWNDHAERYGIASGLLGGFGGFLSREFRDHDFQLGRRNCQYFLRKTFAVPAAHAIPRNWAHSVTKAAFTALGTSEAIGRTNSDFYQLIPLLGSAAVEVPLPEWPRITQGRFETVMNRIAQRFDRIAPALLDEKVNGGVQRWLIGLAWVTVGVRSTALEFIRLKILTDLVRRDQIAGWDLADLPVRTGLDADYIRAVLAELVDPAYDLRSVRGLVKATRAFKIHGSGKADDASPGETEAQVEKLIAELKAAKGKPYLVWEAPWKDKGGQDKEGKKIPPAPLYALASRKPKWYRRLFGAAHAGPFFSKPKVDPPGV